MGTSELWTTDNSLYKFTESTSMNPNDGQIIREPEDLRRRMIHIRHTATSPSSNEQQGIDYAAMIPKPIDTAHPEGYTKQLYSAFMISSLCNNSSIHMDETGEFKSIGDPTEIALTVAAQKGGLGRDYWLQNMGLKKVFERAFDSERKLMSSVYHAENGNTFIDNQKMIMTCKGAPEELLRNCSHYMKKDTNSIFDLSMTMTDDFASQVYDENVRMASQGLRVLGLAYKIIPADCISSSKGESNNPENDGDESSSNKNPDLAESELVFVGLVGLIDPPKQGVKEGVATCQQAGIHVMMITGDHVETATAIASQLGIFKDEVPGMVKLYNTFFFIYIFILTIFYIIRVVLSLVVNWTCYPMMQSSN